MYFPKCKANILFLREREGERIVIITHFLSETNFLQDRKYKCFHILENLHLFSCINILQLFIQLMKISCKNSTESSWKLLQNYYIWLALFLFSPQHFLTTLLGTEYTARWILVLKEVINLAVVIQPHIYEIVTSVYSIKKVPTQFYAEWVL